MRDAVENAVVARAWLGNASPTTWISPAANLYSARLAEVRLAALRLNRGCEEALAACQAAQAAARADQAAQAHAQKAAALAQMAAGPGAAGGPS